MKKIIFILALIAGINASGFSQETNVYAFFVNIVNENYKFPLFGFVNIAKGDQVLPQFGFVNWNTGSFSSLQAGLINTVAGNTRGAQIGLVNTTAKGVEGAQVGLVNISAQKLRGVQVGLVNYADSIEDGIPIGLLSIVREGGYRAIEYSVSEFHLTNMGLKLGVEKFYSTIFAAFDPVDAAVNGLAGKNFAIGLGFGSIIPISGHFFFNPEINHLGAMDKNNQQFTTLVPYFGFQPNKNFSVTIAPSVTWTRVWRDSNHKAELSQAPHYKLYERSINDYNSIVIGARAAARFQF